MGLSEFVVEQSNEKYVQWIGIAIGALIIYTVVDYIHTKYLERKLGASAPKFEGNDHLFGFKLAYHFLKHKVDGTGMTYIQSLFEENKIQTFKAILAGKTALGTIDPENIKALLSTQFTDFGLGIRHDQFAPLLGDGIFTLDGEGWKQSRSMLRPQFAREQIGHVKALEPHVQNLLQHIRNSKGKSFDIQELFFRFTVDSASEFLFGESVDTLKDESIGFPPSLDDADGKHEFAESFNYSQNYIATRAVFQDLYWVLNGSTFRQKNKNVHKFADYYVKRALNLTPEELEKKSADSYTFLYELAKQTRDAKAIRDQALNILVAGRDTTAGLLSFTFYELARHPKVWEKLKEEITANFGVGKTGSVEDITFESLKKCEYLKSIINEALRLYPAVPFNFRLATKNTTLPRGGGENEQSPILVKKGQMVSYAIYTTHRNKAIYGEDAEEFRPERWSEPSTKKLGWAYLPFNGGPRICLGQQFALTEASYVITRLVQEFSQLESFNEPPARLLSHLTMSLMDGCHISLA